MIRNSFILLSGVGEKTERELWRTGVRAWSDYHDAAPQRLPSRIRKHRETHCKHLELAERSLADGRLEPFARWLPPSESWRLLEEAFDDALFLDIETTGLSYPGGRTTVVGMHRPSAGTELLVRGRGLTSERVQAAFDEARLLVTFNGRGFDVPFLEREFGVHAGHLPHVDLMIALRKVGITGGLKRIEVQLGLARDEDIQGVNGYEAVRLWRKWEAWRDERALETLVAYNEADVVNMVPLARIAYDRLSAAMHEDMGPPGSGPAPAHNGYLWG